MEPTPRVIRFLVFFCYEGNSFEALLICVLICRDRATGTDDRRCVAATLRTTRLASR